MTPAQQFFTAYGQSYCSSTRPETLRLRVETDPHSPEEYRINGVVQNMPEFQQAFGCKAGQPMVSTNRCTIW
jgi:putative endopeptidase